MSNYKIKDLQKEKATKMGLTIKQSTSKNKKIDIFDNGVKVSSVGGIKKDGTPYNDYATYIENIGLEKANKKRSAYLKRHAKEPKTKDGKKTNSYYADKILW